MFTATPQYVAHMEAIINEAVNSLFGPSRAEGHRACSKRGCIKRAVVRHYEPDGRHYYECFDHFYNVIMYHHCGTCVKEQPVMGYRSGRSLGGAGTVEVFELKCGHTMWEEDDCIENYV